MTSTFYGMLHTFPFELLHKDVFAPYKQCTYNSHRFFLTIVEDSSRMTWVFLLRYKSDVVNFISTFINLVKLNSQLLSKLFDQIMVLNFLTINATKNFLLLVLCTKVLVCTLHNKMVLLKGSTNIFLI